MHPIERVMRILTHLVIGLALSMVAWIAWSGALVVSGELPIRRGVPVTPATAAPMLTAHPHGGRLSPSWPTCCSVAAERSRAALQTEVPRDRRMAALAPKVTQ